MKRSLLILVLLALGCSTHATKTPSQVLAEYFDAIHVQDTARTFALSSTVRVTAMKPYANEYFENCYLYPARTHIVSERSTSKPDSSVVRFIESVYLRSTGQLVDSSLVDCAMVKENGEWKVYECQPAIERYYSALK